MVTHKLKSMTMWGVSLIVSAFLVMFLSVAPSHAATEQTHSGANVDLETLVLLEAFGDNGDSDLTDWVVVSSLFGSNANVSTDFQSGNLGTWLLYDEVINNGDSSSNLEDLVVLNSVFGNQMHSGSQSDLTTWVLIEELFGDNSGDGILNGSDSSSDLEDLVVLNSLFGSEGNLFGTRTVTVESGDTLRDIAQTYLGDAERYDEIAEMNNISNPDLIYPGQVLQLPSTQTSVGSSSNIESLIVLDAVFGEGSDIFSGDTDLEDLILFDAIFGNGTMMSQ